MTKLLQSLFFVIFCLFFFNFCNAQLIITSQSNGLQLAQRLVGQGVTISNVTLSTDNRATGFFNNISGTNIGLDSGIVLTNGNAKTNAGNFGLDGNGNTVAYISTVMDPSSSGAWASLDLLRAGDIDLDNLVLDPTQDATVLEFDFIPTGDSIKFRYVFSSEEYPEFPCTGVNDVFAFFIKGPGYPLNTNIALIPGTSAPVTIDNINDLASCGLFPQFYTSNQPNKLFTHNGHTKVFTARALVQPCQTYHLKLAIADVGDGIYDSGVLLEAKSLSSNSTTITNITPVDAFGTNYLAEGCIPGKVRIQRQIATTLPQVLTVQYTGTALNGVDVQLLPTTVTIPANQTTLDVDISAIQDNLNEGIETLIISIFSACGNAIPLSSTTLQIRDYETLLVTPGRNPDTAFICRNTSQMLSATTGYTTYTWNTNPTLSNVNIRTPIATPITNISKYVCTATLGSCKAKDSLNLKWKDISLLSKDNIACANGNTGQIKIEAGSLQEWIRPLQFSINGNPYQADSTFNNLSQGVYTVRILDAVGCIDSLSTTLIDLFAAISFTTQKIDPSCLGGANGSFTINALGGKPPYSFSLDNNAYQISNVLVSGTGVHTLNVKDANGCIKSKLDSLSFINTITLSKTTPAAFCESLGTGLVIQSNALSFEWSPIQGLSNPQIINPIAAPVVTTKYFVKAIFGICSSIDSIVVTVLPAPIANAGNPVNACFNKGAQLNGSGGLIYSWTPNTYLSDANVKDPFVINPKVNTTYSLNVIDANGCKSLQPSTVKLTVTPQVRIFAGNDSLVAINQPFQLKVIELSNAGVVKYEWTNPYKLNFSNIYNPIAVLDKDYEYYVTGKTVNDCEGSDTIKLKAYNGPEIYVPNTFTPNRDYKNDQLKPICVGIKSLHYFKIFNRFGELVFETSTINKGWDGFYKGKLQDMATFVWIAEAEDYLGRLIQRKGTSILVH
jgi:gliding motility-associated-like protein